MDPLTLALLGALVAGALLWRPLGRWCLAVGGLAGLLGGVGWVIRWQWGDEAWTLTATSASHSLLWIPVATVIAAGPFLILPALRYRRHVVLLAAAVGYISPLGAAIATLEGIAPGWPVWDKVVALDVLPTLEPVLTFVLLAGVIGAVCVRRGVVVVRAALLVAGFWVALAVVQHQRALDAQAAVAGSRFQDMDRRRVLPTAGNIILWHSVYASGRHALPVMIHVPLWPAPVTVRIGDTWRLAQTDELLEQVGAETPLGHDVRRLVAATDGWVGDQMSRPGVLVDLRRAEPGQAADALPGLTFDPARSVTPAKVRRSPTDLKARAGDLWRQVWFGPPEAVTIESLTQLPTARPQPR